jgi:hypothetical protein
MTVRSPPASLRFLVFYPVVSCQASKNDPPSVSVCFGSSDLKYVFLTLHFLYGPGFNSK